MRGIRIAESYGVVVQPAGAAVGGSFEVSGLTSVGELKDILRFHVGVVYRGVRYDAR